MIFFLRDVSLFLSTLSLRRATRRGIRRYLGAGFLSTLSLRRATSFPALTAFQPYDFYPRSPCGERLNGFIAGRQLPTAFLSTLSLRRATGNNSGGRIAQGFLSTLSLRRATQHQASLLQNQTQFLSTLSLRRATSASCSCHSGRPDFYPRSPCGERLGFDPLKAFIVLPFLSTLSLRRATQTN